MLKAILWDNDGVLVDTEHLYFLATRETLATRGIAIEDSERGLAAATAAGLKA